MKGCVLAVYRECLHKFWLIEPKDYWVVFKEFSAKADYKREVENLRSLSSRLSDHRNLIHCIQAVSQVDSYRVFMHYAECGTLQHLLEGKITDGSIVTEPCSLVYAFRNLVDGVAHLRSGLSVRKNMYCAHLDLKPDNILIYPNPRGETGAGVWKVSDFGISSYKGDQDEFAVQGLYSPAPSGGGTYTRRQPRMTGPRDQSGAYCPPELHPLSKGQFFGRPVDRWLIGCILSEVLCFALGTKDSVERFRNERACDKMDDDYYSDVSGGDHAHQFRLNDAGPKYLEGMIRRYLGDRRWFKKCLFVVCDILCRTKQAP